MRNPAVKPNASSGWAAALVCAAAGIALLQFFGSAAHGYLKTFSLFWWWISQWIDPQAETEHGWLILGIAAWLLVRNLKKESGAEGAVGAGLPREQDGSAKDRGVNPLLQRRTTDATEQQRSNDVPDQRRTTDATGQRRKVDVQATMTEQRLASHEQRATGHAQARPYEVWAAVGAMVAALALHAVGFAAQQARFSILALLLFTWGVLRLGGGRRWGAAAAFPLAYLIFAIPINVLDSLGFWLRMGVIQASAGIAHASGVAVIQSGTQLMAPDGRYAYDVAAACSGVRSLMALAALSLLIGYLNFRTWWRRGLLFALCFPLVYLGNVARIVAIIFAAQLGGSRWGDIAHAVMGYAIFAIVLGGVLGAAEALRRFRAEPAVGGALRREEERVSEDRGVNPLLQPNQTDRGGNPVPLQDRTNRGVNPLLQRNQAMPCEPVGRRGAVWGASFVVALVLGEMVFLHHLATQPERGEVGVVLAADGRNPVELPALLGRDWVGWPAPVSAVEREVLPPDTGYSRMSYVSSRAEPPVFLSIVLSGRDRTSIHRPELCLVGQGWTIDGQGSHAFTFPAHPEATFPATVLRVRKQMTTARGTTVVPQVVVYWFVGGDQVVATHWQRFLVDAWNRVVHARVDRWAYVLLQTDATDGEAAALARLQVILDATLPAFQKPQRAADGQKD